MMYSKNEQALRLFSRDWDLSEQQARLFKTYLDLLILWSERTNLISKNDIQSIVARHFQESMLYSTVDLYGVKRVADLGSGGGFPGIPLKIMHPEWDVFLIESKRIKALFLQEVIEQLGLEGIRVLNERAESIMLDHIDLVTARAVASLKQLWSWAHPWLNPGGCLVTLKGGELGWEEQECLSAFPGCRFHTRDMNSRKLYVVQTA